MRNSFSATVKFDSWDELNHAQKKDSIAYVSGVIVDIFDDADVAFHVDETMGIIQTDINGTESTKRHARNDFTLLGSVANFKLLDLQD